MGLGEGVSQHPLGNLRYLLVQGLLDHELSANRLAFLRGQTPEEVGTVSGYELQDRKREGFIENGNLL